MGMNDHSQEMKDKFATEVARIVNSMELSIIDGVELMVSFAVYSFYAYTFTQTKRKFDQAEMQQICADMVNNAFVYGRQAAIEEFITNDN